MFDGHTFLPMFLNFRKLVNLTIGSYKYKYYCHKKYTKFYNHPVQVLNYVVINSDDLSLYFNSGKMNQ